MNPVVAGHVCTPDIKTHFVTAKAFRITKTQTAQYSRESSMPRHQVTRGTSGEPHDQRHILHIPGLLRVWRSDSHHPSRQNQPTRSPSARRRSLLRNGGRYDLDGAYSHLGSVPDHCGEPSYQPDSPVERPSPFDSWERLHDSLPFDDEDQEPPGAAAPSHGVDEPEPRFEVGQPAWAREEELQEHYLGASCRYRYADTEPRSESRRPHRANTYVEEHPHRSRSATPAPAPDYAYSHPAYPRTSAGQSDRGAYPARLPSHHR